MVSSSPFRLNDDLCKASRGTAMQDSLSKRVSSDPPAAECLAVLVWGRDKRTQTSFLCYSPTKEYKENRSEY